MSTTTPPEDQPDHQQPDPFTFDPDWADDGSGWVSWSAAVHQAIGAASMCWEHPERAGTFDSERAAVIADALLAVSGLDRDAVVPTSPSRWAAARAAGDAAGDAGTVS